MKKKLFVLCMALTWTTALMAQEISVVASDGSTQLYTTLADAIGGAADNSTIYLPGGRFAIADDVKITKKLTIIGIGHYMNNEENEDGYTRIEGNLYFNGGSSGSAVMGCYITRNVYIGYDDTSVNDVLIKYCNLNSLYVKNICSGTIVNQNYIRYDSYFHNAGGEVTNNVCGRIDNLRGGVISNNVFWPYGATIYYVHDSTITGNVFLYSDNSLSSNTYESSNNLVSGNMIFRGMGEDDDAIDLTGTDRNEVFVNFNNGTISPASNFHFKEAYQQYESQVGIYSGTGFNDKQLAPVPYIVAKEIGTETDASGKLNIKIRVKASE